MGGRGLAMVLLAGMLGACTPARAAPTVEMAPVRASAPAAAAQDTTRLTVTGSAEIRVPADRARLRIAVETEAATAAEAAAENAATMTRMLDRVRGLVREADQVETSGYQLFPRYRQRRDAEGGQEIIGYRAANQLVVTVAEVDRIGSVLDAALEGGANRVSELSFFASDTEEARMDALRQATERARREATVLAETLGLTLGAPETIQTSSRDGGGPVMRMGMEAMAMDTPVEPGSQTVSATVTITWRLLGSASR